VRPYLRAAGPRKMQRDYILAILEETGSMTAHGWRWNFTKAARRIGCTRATLYNWLDRHGIERAETRQ
jgi:transcriptional regulator of acetoin/glycerol metabolism